MSPHPKTIRALLLSLAAPLCANAGLGPELQRSLDTAQLGVHLPVVAHLSERFDATALEASLRARRASAATRHRALMEALQEHSSRTQRPILEHLRARPGIHHIRPRWIANLIEFDATPEAVLELARRLPKVVLESHPIRPIEPISVLAPTSGGDEERGHAWNLDQIRVPSLWNMAIAGQGTIVANLDTGVDATHPALGPRWRGHAPDVHWSHAWLSAAPTEFPVDDGTHGTHTMGTMMGADDADTVGVAPAAQWIAAQLNFEGIPGVSAWEAFQWCADPDGDPSTYDDVPDAVNNSWAYITTECTGYDSDAIDNMELLGPIAIFAAANEGPGASTVAPPANRADNAVTNFAVGATDQAESIASFSSRGPTLCDVADSLLIKPEVSAPGVSVRSTGPRNTYRNSSGTSMAAPHTAGAVAILRQLAPEWTADAIKRLLMRHARNPRNPGREDNDYGWGIIDVEAAAFELIDTYDLLGHLRVEIRDAETGDAISHAVAQLTNAHLSRRPGTDGDVRFDLLVQEYTLHAEALGYHSKGAQFQILAGDTTVVALALPPLPTGTLSGTLTGPAGEPATALVQVHLQEPDSLWATIQTDDSGRFSTPVIIGDFRVFLRTDPPHAFEEITSVRVDSATVTDLSRNLPIADVLVVDADGSAPTTELTNYASYFSDALETARRPYCIWDRNLRGPASDAAATMPPSSTILVFSGDAVQEVMTAAEETELIAWLERDGRLLLTGQNLLESIAEGSLIRDHLHLRHIGNTTEHYVPPEADSDLGASLGGDIFTIGFEPPVNQWHQDVIAGGTPVALYGGVSGQAAMVTVEAAENARAVVAGFGLESVHGELPDAVSRAELLAASLEWLMGPVRIEGNAPPVPTGLRARLEANRPNPFNPHTEIRFELSRPGPARLAIFDLRGARVKVLREGPAATGRHSVSWDGTDAEGRSVSSGLYFYRLETRDTTTRRAMILLK